MNTYHPKFLSKAEMEALTTPRLLAYYRALFQVHEHPDYDASSYSTKITREDPIWAETKAIAKAMLDQREHVKAHPRKAANPDKPPRPLCKCLHSYSSHWCGSCFKCECEKYAATGS